MTIQQIMTKYSCSKADAINIMTNLNTPEQLGLTAVVNKSKSHQEKVADKITKK